MSPQSGTDRRASVGWWLQGAALVFVLACIGGLVILGAQAYFRHDDAQILLWATSFKGNVFSVFSFDPAVNLWGTGAFAGMAGYYRPVSYFLILLLVRAFGVNAPVLMGLAAAAMGLALAAYGIVARRLTGYQTALLALTLFFVAYGQVLYQAFRLGVPYGYLLEFGALALLIVATRRRNWLLWVAGVVVFIAACLTRQSAIVLVPAVVLVADMAAARRGGERSLTGPVSPMSLYLAILGLAVLLVGFGGASSGAASNLSVAWVLERVVFYAGVALGGVRAPILVAPIIYAGIRLMLSRGLASRASWQRLLVSAMAACVVAATVAVLPAWGLLAVLMAMTAASVTEPALRVPAVWFLVGFGFYVIPGFYHQAYLLEALLGLALFAAQCWRLVVRDVEAELKSRRARLSSDIRRNASRLAGATVVLALLGLFIWGRPLLLVASAQEAVTGFVQSNDATSRAARETAREAPLDSTVLMFSDRQRQATPERWRDQSLSYRASQVRVFDNADMQAMIGALGRTDVIVAEYGAPVAVLDQSRPMLAFVFSEDERIEMARDWRIAGVVDFSVGHSFLQLLRLERP